MIYRLIYCLMLWLAMILAPSSQAQAQIFEAGQQITPDTWIDLTIGEPTVGPGPEDPDAPDSLVFITEPDFPPFNYLDQQGRLNGFNVDLALAICAELDRRCMLRAVPWSEFTLQLQSGQADAVIASIRLSQANRALYDFSKPYYWTPARFIIKNKTLIIDPSPENLRQRSIAVLEGTVHEAYLRAFYQGSNIRPFATPLEVHNALLNGEVALVFGDWFGQWTWLQGNASENCCRFVGGNYYESYFFGDGIGIALRPGNDALKTDLDRALDELTRNGTYREIWSYYFPENTQ